MVSIYKNSRLNDISLAGFFPCCAICFSTGVPQVRSGGKNQKKKNNIAIQKWQKKDYNLPKA